ncbi:hypothetical protein HDU93_009137 [Gonapodya sp. JEL0774]|nr:hypothetical protein HDU93_009137 [Gonapodya sp. JEL0774]
MLKAPRESSPVETEDTGNSSSGEEEEEDTNMGSTANENEESESDAGSDREGDSSFLEDGHEEEELPETGGTHGHLSPSQEDSDASEASDVDGAEDVASDPENLDASGVIDGSDGGDASDDGESSAGAGRHRLGRSHSHRMPRQQLSPSKQSQTLDSRLSIHRGPASQRTRVDEQAFEPSGSDQEESEVDNDMDDPSRLEQRGHDEGEPDDDEEPETGSVAPGFGVDDSEDNTFLGPDTDMASVEPDDDADQDVQKMGLIEEDLVLGGKIDLAGEIALAGEVALGEEFEGKRKRALQLMTDIEVVFAKLREKLYKEKMQAIEAEEAKVHDGTHPEITQRLRDMETRRDQQLARLAAWKERSLKYVDVVWKDRRRRAQGHYKALRRDLRDRLSEEAVAKRWKAAEESRRMDEALWGVSHDPPDRSVLAKRRKLHRTEASDLSKIQKDRQGFPASLIMGLSKNEMMEDWDKLGIAKLPAGSKPSKSSKTSPTYPTAVSPTTLPSPLQPSSVGIPAQGTIGAAIAQSTLPAGSTNPSQLLTQRPQSGPSIQTQSLVQQAQSGMSGYPHSLVGPPQQVSGLLDSHRGTQYGPPGVGHPGPGMPMDVDPRMQKTSTHRPKSSTLPIAQGLPLMGHHPSQPPSLHQNIIHHGTPSQQAPHSHTLPHPMQPPMTLSMPAPSPHHLAPMHNMMGTQHLGIPQEAHSRVSTPSGASAHGPGVPVRSGGTPPPRSPGLAGMGGEKWVQVHDICTGNSFSGKLLSQNESGVVIQQNDGSLARIPDVAIREGLFRIQADSRG